MREAIGTGVQVLDHGLVRLVDFMGTDLSIIRAARVSYAAAWRAGESEDKDKRLMRRLWRGKPEPKNLAGTPMIVGEKLPELPKHSTPFEAVVMTFEIKAPIFVFRQWHRHRTQSYNELSARFQEIPEEFYLPETDVVGYQSASNKQGRELLPGTMDVMRQNEVAMLKNHCANAFMLYKQLLDSGWPRELARLCLPVGTYSHMFTTMNLLNFFKFASLRTDSHAQYEIRVYADAMLNMVAAFVPEAVELFKEAHAAPF